ncbi:MAG: Gfo/Idh/MocA family protein [Chloroflexota bacterium]
MTRAPATPVGIGMVGCGNVSRQYTKGLAGHEGVRLVACADADPTRAEALATETGIRALTVDALIVDPAVEVVLNLTPVAVHPEVSMAAIAAGRHVHSEKPLATDRDQARRILDAAQQAGVRVGCAPDTFLGSSLQTARAELDSGRLGDPIGCSVAFVNRGPEVFHPAPAQFFGDGAGPVLDVGVYYLTALVHLLGPIRAVTALDRVTFPEREVLVGPAAGSRFPVTVPTHVVGAIEFESGAVGGFTMSFDAGATMAPKLELQGTSGIMVLGDPNTFDDPVRWRPRDEDTWSQAPVAGRPGLGRGIGVVDLAAGIRSGGPHRASGELAYHVLDAMLAIGEAAANGRRIEVLSRVERPAPMGADD